MNLHELASLAIEDTATYLGAFGSELTLCATIVAMLLARVILPRTLDAYVGLIVFLIALAGASVAFAHTIYYAGLHPGRQEIFTGMLVYDGLTVFIRAVLMGFAILFLLFTRLSGIPDREDSADIYTLFLGATIGLCLMASANHLLMIFMAVEMASVPSYALAGVLKGRRLSGEAALKFSVYGAGTAGIMLYGISLLAGLLGEVHLPSIAAELSERYATLRSGELTVLMLATLMILVGLAFKLSAVPFHFWAPDVFEGAPAEVGAFLSVASKAAALALLVRLALGLGYVSPSWKWFSPAPAHGGVAMVNSELGTRNSEQRDEPEASATSLKPASPSHHVALLAEEPGHSPSDAPESSAPAKSSRPLKEVAIDSETPQHYFQAINPKDANARLEPVRDFLAKIIALLAIITCTFGNLAAYGQTNIKRLFAYSTIAHAGYMMMAVPPILALTGIRPAAAESAAAALALYVVIYVFMNLGAFAIIAFFRNAMFSEEIADYAGLIRRAPGMVICFIIILFSLVGLPPFAGFLGKFAVFAALMDAYNVTRLQGDAANYLLITLIFGGLNTAISLFYYLRVAKMMVMEPEPADRAPLRMSPLSLESIYTYAITLPVALLIVPWEWLYKMTQTAAKTLLT